MRSLPRLFVRRHARTRAGRNAGGNVPRLGRPQAGQVIEALRREREVLSEIQRQLDTLLVAVREPSARIARDAPDRLAGAARRAGTALAALGLGLARIA